MGPRVYYNEIDPFAVAWLRELIKARAIADGEIDTRSIVDVRADDLRGFTRCHFFAGIGGWDYALELAGWPRDREVWTGSCPCQPWSVAGRGEGTDDPRHLWPAWFRLLRECRPRTVFGEQAASKDGEYWLDLVSTDLEGDDYALGTFNLPAACVGAPHGRPRFVFVADDDRARRGSVAQLQRGDAAQGMDPERRVRRTGVDGDTRGLANANRDRARQRPRELPGDESEHAQRTAEGDHASVTGRAARDLADAAHGRRRSRDRIAGDACEAHEGAGSVAERARDVGDAASAGPQGRAGDWISGSLWEGRAAERAGPVGGFCAGAQWVRCVEPNGDIKYRPVEPGTFPLAHGIPARVGRLRGYGNAIVPELAALVIEAYAEVYP